MRQALGSTWGLLAIACVVGTGCSGGVVSERDPSPEPADRVLELPDLEGGQSLGDPGPTPIACEEHAIVGVGTTWLEASPSSGKQRHLRCLSEGTAELSGRFVHVVHETNLPAVAGTSVEEADRVYDYPATDRLANQPAAYYAVTEMALSHHASDEALELSAIDLYTGPFFVFDSFYSKGDHVKGESITLGRAGLPGNRLDVHIAAHEYGHHLISSLAPGLSVSTLHEGMADYLSCAFTADATFMRSLPSALQRPCDNDHRWPDDAGDTHQACQLLRDAFHTAGWDDSYQDELETIDACLAMPPPHALEGHQTGMIVSGALWALHEQIGEDIFVPLLLEALRLLPPEDAGDFGMFRLALLGADQAIHRGTHAAVIEDELAWRGISEDVGLAALEHGVGYACLMTPEHAGSDMVPAGPLLPVARARRRVTTD